MKAQCITAPHYGDSAERFLQIAENFDSEGTLIYDKRNALRTVQVAGHTLVVKRYKRPNIFQKITYSWFGPDKSKRAFSFAQRLLENGIDTPAPAAYVEWRKGSLTQRYFFFCELTTATSLSETETPGQPLPEDAAEAFAAFLAEMHSKGFMHGDANLSNILFNKTPDGAFKFSVIDTNRSKWLKREPTVSERVDNLMRVSHNRRLLQDVGRRYARLTGLDPEKFSDMLLRRLASFEARKERQASLKRIIKRLTGKSPAKI